MYIFIFQDIREGLTDNWHSGGGAAVIAESHQRAKELLSSKADDLSVEDIPECVGSFALFALEGANEKVYIFPDKGCC